MQRPCLVSLAEFWSITVKKGELIAQRVFEKEFNAPCRSRKRVFEINRSDLVPNINHNHDGEKIIRHITKKGNTWSASSPNAGHCSLVVVTLSNLFNHKLKRRKWIELLWSILPFNGSYGQWYLLLPRNKHPSWAKQNNLPVYVKFPADCSENEQPKPSLASYLVLSK